MGNSPLDDEYDTLPPSFTPSSRRQRPSPHPQRLVTGSDRSSAVRGLGDDGMPVSFQPRRSSAAHAAHAAHAAPTAGGTGDGGQPPSFQPRRMPRTSAERATRRHVTGGTRVSASAMAAPSPSASWASDAPRTSGRESAPVRVAPRTMSPSRAAVRIRHVRPRVGRIVAAVLAALLVAASIGAFSAYRWIDGQLNHFDALTGMADGSESTWLIVGSDARDGTAGGTTDDVPGERTDTIMLLIKPRSGPSALVSIPRDSYVTVNDQDMKINAAVMLGGGWTALTGAVEGLTGTKVDHVVKIGFRGVKDVVDAVGGINVCYDGDVSDPDSGMEWTAGCHDVDGDQALAFSRMRYQDPEGDIGRAKRQRQVIQKIAAKAASPATLLNPGKAGALIKAGLASVDVDEDATPMSLASMALAFKAATGSNGITGTAAIANVDYWPDSGIGSTVLLDSKANAELFGQLRAGTHKAGTVGGTS